MKEQKWYETSEDLLMPLPLTEEEARRSEGNLTEEAEDRRRFPSITLPNNTNITVLPIIPGITRYGYIRFLNASPAEQRVDIYANGRRVATDLLYREFTEYLKVLPGWYRIAVYAAGTTRYPLTVTILQVRANGITTLAVIGLANEIDVQRVEDTRRRWNRNRAYVRFVQLSPNAPVMDAYWDDALVVSDLEYREISRYLMTAAGKHNLKMRDSLSGANLVEHPNIRLAGGKAYTIYIVGDVADRTGLQVLIPLEGSTYLDFGE